MLSRKRWCEKSGLAVLCSSPYASTGGRDQFNIELRRLRSSGTGLAGLLADLVELNTSGLPALSPFSDSALAALLMQTIKCRPLGLRGPVE